MAGKEIVIERLNEAVERLIGCQIGTKYIQNDKKGWLKYIPPGSLYRGRPLILSHYVGALLLILPHKDYQDLIRGKIPIYKYIRESVWSYGYFWGGANIKNGIYWQTLEGGRPGISDTAKIRRYLTMMQCRTCQHHLGIESFDSSRCMQCSEKRCPVSPLVHKLDGAKLEDEFDDQKPRRLEFYEAIAQTVYDRFALKASTLHIEEKLSKSCKEIYLVPGFSKGTCKILLSQDLYIDMMYYPEKYDIAEMMQTYSMMAATQSYNDKTGEITFDRAMKITPDTKLSDINIFWNNRTLFL